MCVANGLVLLKKYEKAEELPLLIKKKPDTLPEQTKTRQQETMKIKKNLMKLSHLSPFYK